MALLAVSLFALAEMTVFVYQKDGTKDEYLAANVDSIGFVNVFTITFDANGGDGSMDVVKIKEGETITLPDNTFAKGSSTFAGWNTQADGTGTAYADKASVSIVASQTLYAQWEAPIADGHEWVDLGLPSGTKWATCNVGATTPEGYGDYFYWGDTSPISNKYSSYLDSPTTLPLERDAAYVNWGSSWRMPTIDELYELRDYTTFISTTQNGVVGYYITSKTNGNSIFLPLTGKCFYRSTSELDYVNRGDYGCYWSSSFSQDSPVFLFCKTGFQVSLNTRHIGYTVRPVLRE